MDQFEENALKNIEDYGCHVLHVLEEDEHPGFSYSVGIEKSSGRPELIVIGLDQEIAHWIVNEYNSRIQSGEIFETNEFYSDFLEGFEVTFKAVEKKHFTEYFGLGKWLYNGEDFNALQLIYPSTSGIWPWDKNAPDDFTWYAPKLYAD